MSAAVAGGTAAKPAEGADASSPIHIDGSILEGGGQILRNSTALACLLQRSLHISSIRAGRSKPGLGHQHATGIDLVARMCGGRVEGGQVGSSDMRFQPGPLVGGTFAADTHTAGSIALLVQIALPCMLFSGAPTELVLRGGTNAEFAPQVDYLTRIFVPIACRMGIVLPAFEVVKRGYFPRGGGEVRITADPVAQLQPLVLDNPGRIVAIRGYSYVAGHVPKRVAAEMADAARELLEREFPHLSADAFAIELVEEPRDRAFGEGAGLVLVAESDTGCLFGGSALGRKKVPAKTVGKDAARSLADDIKAGGCMDRYLQDQFIIFMALAVGSILQNSPLVTPPPPHILTFSPPSPSPPSERQVAHPHGQAHAAHGDGHSHCRDLHWRKVHHHPAEQDARRRALSHRVHGHRLHQPAPHLIFLHALCCMCFIRPYPSKEHIITWTSGWTDQRAKT